jgi:RNA polymerase sigma-32 factor
MDLIQEGNVGLMKAVSKYDSAKGAKLSYYASWWIRSYILKFLLDNFRMVKIGTTNEQKKLFYNLMREKERLLAQGLGADPKLIGEALGVSEKSVIEMGKRMAPSSGDISLDAPIDHSDGATISDFMAQTSAGPEEEVASHQELDIMNNNLKSFLDNLKPRDREVFSKRLMQEVPESLQTIADQYGVTRERIRQIEERLLQQLRVYMSQYLR